MLVLIAEDDPISRALLRRRLIRMGHEVLEASDGQEGLNLLKSRSVQCVITDWMMPLMDGLELVRLIREAEFRQYIYIILLTAKTDVNDVVAGLEAGADDYLIKPFNARELTARVGIASRIVELEQRLREARDAMEILATRDSLTGLLNRRTIMEHAEAELNRAYRMHAPVAFALLDVDHFKTVNDRFGHLVGDEALRHVASILQKNVRPYDWVGRWGGEEFMIVLPGTNGAQARDVAERIRGCIAATPLRTGAENEETLNVSIGVTVGWPTIETSLDSLLQRADEALYRAKASGRDLVFLAEE